MASRFFVEATETHLSKYVELTTCEAWLYHIYCTAVWFYGRQCKCGAAVSWIPPSRHVCTCTISMQVPFWRLQLNQVIAKRSGLSRLLESRGMNETFFKSDHLLFSQIRFWCIHRGVRGSLPARVLPRPTRGRPHQHLSRRHQEHHQRHREPLVHDQTRAAARVGFLVQSIRLLQRQGKDNTLPKYELKLKINNK